MPAPVPAPPLLYPPVIPDQGVQAFMDIVISAIRGGGLVSRVHLFQNWYTPNRLTTLVPFVEATFGGYGAQVLGQPFAGNLTPEGLQPWTWPMSTWTATGAGLPQAIYGFWVDVLDPITLTTRVLWTQRFVAPVVLVAAGNPVQFTLSLGGRQV